jgi:hypothetical protein
MAFFDEIARRTGQMIRFTSVSSNNFVEFPAFITHFSDDYSVQWGTQTIFGRIDPIKNYVSTGRRIQASFDILGRNEEIALENFQNYSKLIQMLYPTFSEPVGPNPKSRTIKGAPLLRIKYANYIQSNVSEKGLLGCIQGVTFQPKFEAGHFFSAGRDMIPLSYSMNFVFEPLHEAPLGFDPSGHPLQENFPYKQENLVLFPREPASDPLDG